jgi:Flp pilus assembly protein TadD
LLPPKADSRARALAIRRNRKAGQGALMQRVRVFFILAGSLVWLGACTSAQLTEALKPGASANASADPTATGTVEGGGTDVGLLGTDPKDDLSLGKHHFRQENFGLSEHYFRRAAESHPRDAEAWLGLAASYDRLRRFELADRAYKQVIAIAGVTPEVLNNQGYSYILRGDYARARSKLAEARALDPKSPFILNNIRLLDESARKGKAVQ